MIISDTVNSIQPSATIAAATKAKQLKSEGIDVLEFTLGEPDFGTPEHICNAAQTAMAAGDTHYTWAGATVALKQAICDRFEADHGVKYSPSQVVVSNGAKHSIHNALTALLNPGDEVIIPTPYWVSYSDLVVLTGAKPVFVDTTVANGFAMQVDQFKAAITDRTKILMLNSPSNPTGAVYPVELLQELAEICVEHDITILSDEIYDKLLYESAEAPSLATFGDAVRDRTIVVNGVSKAYAMTGWRIGWTLSPEPVAKAMTKLQSQETSCPSSISQAAAKEAVSGPQECVTEMLAAFTKRRTFTLDRLRQIDGLSMATPGGAFYAFFDVSSYFGKPLGDAGVIVDNASDFCTALLEHAHVAFVTGDAFGAPGFVRMSYATDIDTIGKGIDRLAAFLRA